MQHGIMENETTETSTSGCGRLFFFLMLNTGFNLLQIMPLVNYCPKFRFSHPWNGNSIALNGWHQIWRCGPTSTSQIMEYEELIGFIRYNTWCNYGGMDWILIWHRGGYISYFSFLGMRIHSFIYLFFHFPNASSTNECRNIRAKWLTLIFRIIGSAINANDENLKVTLKAHA